MNKSPVAPSSSPLRALIERSGATQAGPSERAPDADAQERCGLCGLPVPDRHRHVLELRRHEVLCACRACSLLFDRSAAGAGHYRLIPERCVRLDGFDMDDVGWRSLGIPVQIAFFVRAAEGREVRAFYPSLAGATQANVPNEAWLELESANPRLAALEPDVEALLVNRLGSLPQAFMVGLDDCYRLVAVVREHWRGFTGGERVWREVERFFSTLDARAGRAA